MIREILRAAPGQKPSISRWKCLECGERFDVVELGLADKVDHHCPRHGSGAWWIVRRPAELGDD